MIVIIIIVTILLFIIITTTIRNVNLRHARRHSLRQNRQTIRDSDLSTLVHHVFNTV